VSREYPQSHRDDRLPVGGVGERQLSPEATAAAGVRHEPCEQGEASNAYHGHR